MAGKDSNSYMMKRTFFALIALVPLLLFLYRRNVVNFRTDQLVTENSASQDVYNSLTTRLRGKNGSFYILSSSEENEGDDKNYTGPDIREEVTERTKGNALEFSETAEGMSEYLKTPWRSVGGTGEKDSFHLFSAYYDNRSAIFRPSVVILGYAWNEAKGRPLFCLFRYEDGHSECVKKPLVLQGIASCMRPNLGGLPYFFYCPAQQQSAPVSVKVSESANCHPESTSEEVLVANREQKKKSSKTFGICLGGPVIGNKNSWQDLVDFISVNKILGADLITFYIIPEKLNRTIVDKLLVKYPRGVRFIEWKNLALWNPLHYYGQYLMIQDCLYRSMYEVDYLFHQDLDEVIIPISGTKWSETVKKIPGLERGAGFKHQNSFFLPDKQQPSVTFPLDDCGGLELPKYLTRTKILPCFPGYNYRSKPMTRPRLTLEVAVHDVCQTLHGYSGAVQVPTNVAILGHFRNEIPRDCQNQRKTPVVENWAMKYSNELHKRMCSIPTT